MARIKQMNEHLTNMIAAGEVVERPMGIVKECIENSIDAHATRIEVWITQGGIEEIEIADNGMGMDKEDALMAFERHATSKISDVNDLWTIATLGFRGEALPSIASVSSVELRTNNTVDSTRVVIDYGTVSKVEPFGCNPGTEIVIRGIFQKTPARLKHLKSAQYEAALVSDVVQKFALSHPEIAFRLMIDGKETFKTFGTNNLQEVIFAIYGRDVAKNTFEIKGEDFDSKVTGYGVLPSISRVNRNYIHIFINKRMVRSFKLQKAISDAYHQYMADDRYPIAILHIELDEQLIDVNVHPSKWEIRLSKEQQLLLLIQESMKQSLMEAMQIPEIQATTPVIKERVEQTKFFEEKSEFVAPVPEPVYSYQEIKTGEKLEVKEAIIEYDPIQTTNNEIAKSTENKPQVTQEYKEEPKQEAVKRKFPELTVLAQMHGKYILTSSSEGLVIIDQHAAQERYNYERFKKVFETKNADMLDLLVPINIETTTSVVMQLEEVNRIFSEIQIQFEEFSNNSLIVRSIPVWMQGMDETLFLQDCLESLSEEKVLSKAQLNRDRLATQACHHSIRFNRFLTMEEMMQVVKDLENCDQPFHCPHGRPTMITITEAQLVREFKR